MVRNSLTRLMKRRSTKPAVQVKKADEKNNYEVLEGLMDEIWQAMLDFSPESASFLGYSEYNDRLSEMTVEADERMRVKCEEFLERVMAAFPEEDKDLRMKTWSLDQRVTLGIVKDKLEDAIASSKLQTYLICCHTMENALILLPMLVAKVHFDCEKDYEMYKTRMADVPRYLEAQQELLRKGIEERVTPPRVSVESIPSQIEAMLAEENSSYLAPLGEKFDKSGAREELREEIRTIIEEQVLPAFKSFAEFLSEEYIPNLSEELSVPKRCKNGEELYSHVVRQQTTTTMTPEEIHELGLKEVERIWSTMERIAEEEGFDSVAAYQEHLDEVCVCKTEEELLKYYKNVAGIISPKLPAIIGKLPRTTFGIKPVPAYYAPHAPAAYYEGPPKDLSAGGYFSLNTSFLENRKTYIAEALVLHEAAPGHHLQIALQTENQDIPTFRKYAHYTAYIEGWGLYCEYLGEEMKMYEKNSSLYGRLVIEMMRACRLVVDTGMNYLGWSKEKSMQYMMDNRAGSPNDIDSETTRYVAIPGQALSYKIGEIKIKELRALSEDRLGKKFDVRKFHDLVLSVGSVPLTVLEEIVTEWIEEQL